LFEIYFEETLDAKKIYERLLEKKQALLIKYIDVSFNEDKKLVYFSIVKNKDYVIDKLIIPVLTNYIISKEDLQIRSMIETVFYFTDIDEQNQILELTHALINGSISDVPDLYDMEPREETIISSFKELLKEPVSFSFESFIKFRLRNYSEQLRKYVELAIDEYKLEQEYQNFIQNLRDFMIDRRAKFEKIHILHDEQFVFYNNTFTQITRDEMMKYIDRKLILNHPMYIDSTVLAPLVSIAPESINIYTNQVDHGMVQTVQNIFLERVQIFPKHYFEQSRTPKHKM